MAEQTHERSARKRSGSGGMRKRFRSRRLYEIGGAFTATKIKEEEVRKSVRCRGGNVKIRLKRACFVNVATPEGTKKAKIKTVIESPANRDYARKNIITKGTIIDTEIGKVKVTNKVGKDGVVNGILLL